MLNASIGAQRVLGRLRRSSSRPTATTVDAHTGAVSLPLRGERGSPSSTTHIYPVPRRRRRRTAALSLDALRNLSLPRPTLRGAVGRFDHERIVALAAAGILLGASVLSVAPGGASGATGGPSGDGPAPRLAVGGSDDGDDVGSVEDAYVPTVETATEDPKLDAPLGGPDVAIVDTVELRGANGGVYAQPGEEIAIEPGTPVEGSFLEDGTLLKPVAVDTSVADGSDLIRTYKVKAGDTLATIAGRFGISTMTLWWANDLKSKDSLVRGQVLNVPPVSGLVVEVRATDTLASLAKTYKLSEDEILTTNGLDDPNLVVGQVLVLAGARGAPIATPKPTSRPNVSVTRPRSSGGGSSVTPPKRYTGGNFAWPTSSRRISQYYHYGHYGLDIDGSTGDPIYAASGGTVTFAGWKNNGGGYQVWIAHGSGLYTTYNHMSGVSVGRGQTVSKGQRVGRMGSSGYSSGSHLHFEVWKGPVWNGGRRVNPLGYY